MYIKIRIPTLLSARVKKMRPRHMKAAAVKSISPYLLPCMRIPPINTGMSLQHLNMTWRTEDTCEVSHGDSYVHLT